MSAPPITAFAPASSRPGPAPPVEYMDTGNIEFSAGTYEDSASLIDRLRAEADRLFVEEVPLDGSYDDDPDPFVGGEYFSTPATDNSSEFEKYAVTQ